MGQRFSLELSDTLTQLSAEFDELSHCGVALTGDMAHEMGRQLRALRDMARKLETEVSRHRWNEPALRDRLAEAERIVAEAMRPGTNLRLLAPAFAGFTDGH